MRPATNSLHNGPAPGDSGPGSRVHGWARIGPFLFAHKSYDSSFSQSAHAHEIASFDFNIQGGGEGVVGRRRQESVAGEVEYFPYDVPHSFRCGTRGIRVLHLSFRPEGCRELGMSLGVGRASELHIDQAVAAGAAARVLGEMASPDVSAPLILEELALRIIGASEDTAARRAVAPPWIDKVRQRLHAQLDATVPLAALARDVGIDRAHLARTFMACTGQTCGQYHRRIRVAAAQRMLARGNVPVSRVAHLTGFADQAHLTRWFGHIAGLTPARFVRALERPAPTDID